MLHFFIACYITFRVRQSLVVASYEETYPNAQFQSLNRLLLPVTTGVNEFLLHNCPCKPRPLVITFVVS